MATVNRVGRVLPLALHPHQVGQARAVHMFVEHPHRNRRLVAREFREGEFEFGLPGFHGGSPDRNGIRRRTAAFAAALVQSTGLNKPSP